MNIEIPNNQEADIEEINQPSSCQNPTCSYSSRQFSIHNFKNLFERKKSTLDTGDTENGNIELKKLKVTKNEQTSKNAHQSTSFEIPQASTSVSNNTVQNLEIKLKPIDEKNNEMNAHKITISYLYPNNFIIKRIKYLQCRNESILYDKIESLFFLPLTIFFLFSIYIFISYSMLNREEYKNESYLYAMSYVFVTINLSTFIFTIFFYVKAKTKELNLIYVLIIMFSIIFSMLPVLFSIFLKYNII